VVGFSRDDNELYGYESLMFFSRFVLTFYVNISVDDEIDG
jgi:hypothetical protein